jgi:hypothetical protein
MKFLVLIIANDCVEMYVKMQELWRKYMHSHPHFKCYFIKFSPTLDKDVVIDNDTIYFKGSESVIPGIITKSVLSLKYSLENFEFDYIYRTNLTSVVDFNKAYYILTRYKNKYKFEYSGFGISYFADGTFEYADGCAMILSKKTCKEIIHFRDFIDYGLQDDCAIGQLLTLKLGYSIENIGKYRYDIGDINECIHTLKNAPNYNYVFHFRCKKYEDYTNTLYFMDYMINLIYFS